MCLILILILHLTRASLPTNASLPDLLAHSLSSFQRLWQDKSINNAVVGMFGHELAILNLSNEQNCKKTS